MAFKGTLKELALVLLKMGRIERKDMITKIQLDLNKIFQLVRTVKYQGCLPIWWLNLDHW